MAASSVGMQHIQKVMSAENESKLFLEYTTDNGWTVNKDGRDLLDNVKGPIHSVAIIGPARSGKSFLMNMLHQKENVFRTGDLTTAVTKGIWICLTKHPTKSREWLLLLDTEGLKHKDRESAAIDTQICTLALLLCRSLIFNIQNTLDSGFNEDLQCLVHYTNRVQVKAKSIIEDFHKRNQSPNLYVAVRNFTLRLSEDSADGYLASALKEESGTEEAKQCRQAVDRYFPKRHCFLLPLPSNADDFSALSVRDLKGSFTQELNRLRSHVFKETKALVIEGKYMDGKTFVALAENFAQVVSKGGVMCIEKCMYEVKQGRNTEIVSFALEKYKENMAQVLRDQSPLSREDFHHKHMENRLPAVKVYISRAYFDPELKHFFLLWTEIEESYKKEFKSQNNIASRQCSKAVCKECFKNILEGDYKWKGGYAKFEKDKQAAIDEYKKKDDLGPCKLEVLEGYLETLKERQEIILENDGELWTWQKIQEKCVLKERQLTTKYTIHSQGLKEEKHVHQLEMENKDELNKILANELENDSVAVRARYEEMIREKKEEINELDVTEQDSVKKLEEDIGSIELEMEREMKDRLTRFEKAGKFLHELFIKVFVGEEEAAKKKDTDV